MFKEGDRIYNLADGWLEVIKMLREDGALTVSGYRCKSIETGTHRILLPEEINIFTGEAPVGAKVPVKKKMLVYRWEKKVSPKKGDAGYKEDATGKGFCIIQSQNLAPKGSIWDQEGWDIVPGSEREIEYEGF